MIRAILAVALAASLAACGSTAGSGAGAGGTSTPAASAPTARSSATSAPTASAATAAPAADVPLATPSTAASCAASANGTLMEEQALLVGVRVGTHDGYDRVVFEFTSRGAPTKDRATFEIGRTTPPYFEDPSGRPLTIAGDPVLAITFHGATIQTLASGAAYSGSRDFKPRYPVLSELKSRGDFEAVSSWLAGLTRTACVKAQVLTNPTRLVLDLMHP